MNQDIIKELVDKGATEKDLFFATEIEKINENLEKIVNKEDETISFPEIQKVEITNLPEEKEVPAPIVNVSAPVVNIDTDSLRQGITGVRATLNDILNDDGTKKVLVVDEDGKPVDFNKKNYVISDGGGSLIVVDAINHLAYLSSTSTNGTRDLTSANTWYSVPSTVPASPYILVATIENSVGTVRFGFDNTGTPSATNGNQAPYQLTVRLAGGQVVYFASSTAGDDVNWTCKVI